MLPDIVSAAYVYSTNQSAVQVTYIDAATAIVYPNQFENPLTQQLLIWVRGGGQITAYIPPIVPTPGPPAYISCYIESEAVIAYQQDITTWGAASSLGLSLTNGTSVQLQAGRAYQIDLTLGVNLITLPPNFLQFTLVNAATNAGLLPGENINNLNIRAIQTGQNPPVVDAQNQVPSLSYIYVPTEDVSIKVRLTGTGAGNTNTGNVRQLYSSWTIAELVDEAIYAEKVGPRGPVGPQGALGPTGPSGPTGPQGSTGVAGPTGPGGPTGAQGQPGPGFDFLGTVATVGALPAGATQGDAYSVTSTNTLWIYDGTAWNDAGVIQGPQGVQGNQGPAGATGPAGAQGPAGPAGPAGSTGAQGPIGLPGPTGATGSTGSTGSQGPVGPIGPQGPQGLTGPAGPSGSVTILSSNPNGGAYEINQGVYSNAVTYATINLPLGTTSFFITVDICPLSATPGRSLIEPQINYYSNGGGGGTSYSASNASAVTVSGQYLQIPASQSWGQNGLVPSINYTIALQFTGGSYNVNSTLGYDYTVICWS